MIYKESRFKASARSHAGAVGLMQLLPDTAEGIAIHTGGTQFDPATDLLNPDLNVRYGCWYLRHLMNKYRRRAERRRPGARGVQRRPGERRSVDRATPRGQPVAIPFAETRDYVDSIHDLRDIYRKAYGPELSSG